MFWAFWVSIFALVIASPKPGQAVFHSPKKCQIRRNTGVVYSPRASNHHGKIIRSTNSSDESVCRTSCCETPLCTLYMFSTVHILHSRHVNCLLISCENKSLCATKRLPENETELSIVGIRQDNVKNTSEKQSKTHSHITNTSLLRRPTSINATADHTSRIKGKTKSNSNMSHSIAHNGTNHTGRPSNYGTNHTGQPFHYGTNHTGRPSHTNHSHSIASINQKQNSLLQSSVNWTSLLVEVSNGSHHKSKLGHSNNYTKVHLSSNISHHSLSPLGRNLSAVSLAVKNLSTSFPYVQNMSFSASYSPTPSFVIVTTSISETASMKTNTMIGGSLSSTTVSRIPGDSSAKLQDSQSSHYSSHTPHIPTNSTKRKNPSKKFSESRSHTTPVSLVISLIIGILFLGTLVFLIGRRWGETCFRRGYSRVDYLLNDYD